MKRKEFWIKKICFLLKIDKALRCVSIVNISACEYHTENRD